MREVLGAVARNRFVLRVVLGYAGFTIAEYSVWVAMLVYAYAHGGATAAGLIAAAQLLPAAAIAPLASVAADRASPVALYLVGCAAQAVGMAVTAVVIVAGGPEFAAYAGAVVASTAVATIRPAQAALLPMLARTADELTGANVVVGGIESVGIAIAGLLSAALLSRGPGAVFAAAVILITGSAVAIAAIPAAARPDPGDTGVVSAWADMVDGARAMAGAPGARPLVGMLCVQDVVVGALDILFVVLALSVLHDDQSWAGYLNTAFGAGGVLAGMFTALLIGRRLPAPILVASVVVGVSLGLSGFTHNATIVVVLLVAVGASRAVLDLATRTLLQRSVPSHVVGRVFGLVEAASLAGVAVGSITASALVAVAGAHAALVGVGALLPAFGLLSARRLLKLDRETRVPIVEINLLRSLPMFSQLPPPALESTARALQLRRLPAGETLIAEGATGDHYYAIADGDLEVSRHGSVIRHCGRGTGVGEIALLRSVPRTATVTASTASLVYALDRDSFLVAITGHPQSRTAVARSVDRVLLEDLATD